MLTTKTFEEVAAQEGAVFSQVDNKYLGDRGSFVHSSIYTLECKYRNVVIHLKNEFGHQNIGTVSCQLRHQPNNCEFAIETINSFFQLFNRTISHLKLTVENPQLKNFIERNLAYIALNRSAKKDRFEPRITGENDTEKYLISCEYHLVFNNQQLVISPFIAFFKALIDFFEDQLMQYK